MQGRPAGKGAFCVKTHQELVDSYLDASWALAMEKVALRQGELAEELEERLKQDPDAAVPGRTIKRCRAAMRKAFAPPPVSRFKTVLARVVMAAVLCGLLTTVACAVSPQFKEFLTRIFYSVTEVFTAFTLQDPQTEDVGALQGHAYEINGVRFEWLPEGYEYVDGQETERLRRVEFENAQHEYIQIRVMGLAEAAAYTYDSEESINSSVMVGEFEGQLIERKGSRALLWIDDQQDKAIFVIATDLSQESILQLARALRY